MIENRIGEACDAIRDGWYSNCTQAAKVYEVSVLKTVEWRSFKDYTSSHEQCTYGGPRGCDSQVQQAFGQDEHVCLTQDDCGRCKLSYSFWKSCGGSR